MKPETRRITKRDGKLQAYDRRKVEAAIFKAGRDVPDANLSADSIASMAKEAEDSLIDLGMELTVENMQDAVEIVLMELEPIVAKAFILYRDERRKIRERRLEPDARAIMDYIHTAKYARHLPDVKRREMYKETVSRSFAMHAYYYDSQLTAEPWLKSAISEAFEAVYKKRVLPSMRSMQFGGKPLLDNNTRMYNCAFTLCDRLRVFGEIFHCLLSGSGVGYSVQFQHVEKLPECLAIDRRRVRHFTVPDTIEGWSDAVNELIRSHFVTGDWVEFDYSGIRPEGAPLSSGGRAPGHLPLRKTLEAIRSSLVMKAGRKLRPIEWHDIICWLAEAVLAGGIRRSALISLFSVGDSEMMYAKAHGNFRMAKDADPGVNNQRQMANNSAVLVRGRATREQLGRVILLSREWGDPGFYWTDDPDCGCNPCGEIGMRPCLDKFDVIDTTLDFVPIQIDSVSGPARYFPHPETAKTAIAAYGSPTGFQFCNLVEINAALCKTSDDLVSAAKAASLIGTLQAGYNRFPYLGPVTELIVRREALLGVGITGMADSPAIAFDPDTLHRAGQAAQETNHVIAAAIGIERAARLTTVKPSGTASLELGCVGSGISPHHARRYFRRVTANRNEVAAAHFASMNPHMVEEKPDGDLSITFPVQAPKGARTVKELPAAEFMEQVFVVYEHWVRPWSRTRMLTHNISCTVSVQDDEWNEVVDLVWENRARIAAMTFISAFGDKKWPFAPREEVLTEADEARWNYLIENYRRVDWLALHEEEDGTTHAMEPACAGGSCET